MYYILNIDINKIPAESCRVVTRKNGEGAKFATIFVAELKNADERGNTLTCYTLSADKTKVYNGRGYTREFTGANNAPSPTPNPAPTPKPKTTPAVAPVEGGYKEEDGDLPF